MANKWVDRTGVWKGRPIVVVWVRGGNAVIRYTDTRMDSVIGEREIVRKSELNLSDVIDVELPKGELT